MEIGNLGDRGACDFFALTEQNPVQTSTLSSAVNNAIVAQHDCEAGDGATALSNTDTSVSSSAFAGVGKVMFSYASVRIWAHAVVFFALGIPVSLALVFWWGRSRGLLLRASLAFPICVFASLFDQTHKLFVPGRELDAGDLLFDLLGYSIAIGLSFIVSRSLDLIRTKSRLSHSV